MKSIEIQIKTLPHFEGLPLPEYQTEGSSGFDLIAACEEDVLIAPLQRALIPTGLSFSFPHGYEVQIRPRSGLALKNGITLPNSPGTIDADYRGEVKVILLNLGQENFTVTRGMRIAQAIVGEVVKAKLTMVDMLDATHRGSGGFGHTGV
jgi:dUTP pyrophosphatase